MVSLNRNQYISKSRAIMKAKALTILMQQQNELIQIRAESSLVSKKFLYANTCDVELALSKLTRNKIHNLMNEALIKLYNNDDTEIDFTRIPKCLNIYPSTYVF